MTKNARTNDHRAEPAFWLEWIATPETDERAVAREMIATLEAFCGSWFEPLAIEVMLGCYDRSLLDRAPDPPSPPKPYQTVVSDQAPAWVDVHAIHRAVVSRAPALSAEAISAWIGRLLEQPCGDPARYETSLIQVYVRAARIRLPPSWGPDGELLLECYAGLIKLPTEARSDGAWVAGPPVNYVLHRPIDISISNDNGNVHFLIQIYWSPWVGERGRADSDLAQAVTRLVARGWQPATD